MDNWTTPILHVDMDAFFVEVERRRRPELVGVPVIVGGLGRRGVVASCSYEARAHGVRSAMPMAQARRLCPQAQLVAPDMSEYRNYSVRVFEVLRAITPHVEPLSVDEAFLDVSGLRRHYENPQAVAQAIRRAVRDRPGLPASVGIAPNKFLAKLASGHAKPDGLFTVEPDHVRRFLDPLPVRALWGVGEATLAALEGLGVSTVADLGLVPPHALSARLGDALASHLIALAAGRDPRPVERPADAKSLSVEQTFPVDISGRSRLETELLAQADRLATRLHQSGLGARTVSIKIRYVPFETVTRAHTESGSVQSARELFAIGCRLLDKIEVDRPIRLVGLAASSLQDRAEPQQLGFDDSGPWAELADTVEDIKERFGSKAIRPARLVDVPDLEDPDRLYGPTHGPPES